MRTMTFHVTVTVEHEYTNAISVDEDEYREWLGNDEDTKESRLKFLQAGDELEVIADVSNYTDGEVIRSEITAVA